MRYTITGRNIEVTPGLKAAVEKKIGKLEHFFTPDTEVIVALSAQKDQQKIEVTIPVKGNTIRAEESSTDMYVSIDLVEEIIERQIRRYRKKLIDKKQAALSFSQLFIEEAEEAEETKLYSANKLTNEQKENLLRDITRIMEETEEFCDYEFSLERLASLIGSNSRYVSQIINETYNKNFRTFVNEYRIKEARIRLMNTAEYGNYTIKAIAESVGYKSHTNFIDIFKKITGITPSIYQKIAKEGKRVYD